ncbi:MAG: 1-acyl-sn-glycerol-3-phosphate acyltransferase, partial [Bacteroidales bacterium]|nr:1-acyl-sn-glycerol-3-phosphate acyltransferase [Bacteroidales bacterium]
MKKYKINKGFQLLAKIFLFFFTKRFKITADISDEIKNIDEPYILLSNHVGFWDPFVVSNFIKKYPHFVSSDAVMKDPIKRFFLERYKIIPKRKNMRDTQVIRTLLEYIKNGEAVALFPEATRTWTGNTLHIDDSIGKLIKLLNVPVITVKMQGMFLFNPRWAYSTRNAAVNIVYKLMADKEKLSRLSSQEITVLLKADLEHSESEYQKNAQVKIRSNKRAEYL